MEKAEALLEAVRRTKVGEKIVLHNEDLSVWCVLKVVLKEHDEDRTGNGLIRGKG